MRKLRSSAARGLRRSLPAILLAPAVAALFAVALFTANWRELTALRTFVVALAYAYSIGVPARLVLPAVVRRVGRRPARLALATAAVMLPLIGIGCLAGGAVLVATGLSPASQFWSVYGYTVRIAATLGIVIAAALYFYESLAAQLQETRLRLQQRELEQERERKLALEARLASLESRIHPHFLFNTLNSISALIPVDAERAEEMLGRLAALLRSSLDSTRKPFIPLSAELGLVKSYLDIETARFGDRLRFRFTAPSETQELLVPPLAVQCLVENAVKHGIAKQVSGGEIEVVARLEPAGLRIEVRDSGPGFDLAGVSPGHGLDNLVARLETLFGSAARLEVARRDDRCVVALLVPATRAEAAS
ncbi:MAG: histidine kinase [Bryobacteraceae bacterium]|jgi:sensor histidine kinase YesM